MEDVLFLLHQVCMDVTEMRCNIHLSVECRTTMTDKTYPADKKVKVHFTPKTCTDIQETIYHTKLKPQCKTEEKEVCSEAWKTLADGTKVLHQINI